MKERPTRDLINSLKQLRPDVNFVEERGCLPVTINTNSLDGGKVGY